MIRNEGFTLIEMVVYLVLVGFLSIMLLLNLYGAQTNASVLERAALAVMADFRRAQIMTVSGLDFQGSSVCGYGVHYLSPNSYLIYAGGEAVCSTANRNYQSTNDLSVQTVKIIEGNVEFKISFNDVFFEPPDPKTFINNSFSLTAPPLPISMGFRDQNCPTGCGTVNIFPSGKMDFN